MVQSFLNKCSFVINVPYLYYNILLKLCVSHSGGTRGAGAGAGTPGHGVPAPATARARQQERRAARARTRAGRRWSDLNLSVTLKLLTGVFNLHLCTYPLEVPIIGKRQNLLLQMD